MKFFHVSFFQLFSEPHLYRLGFIYLFDIFSVSIKEPIEPTLELKFESERITRLIEECNDINTLRQIAIELVNLHQKKSAIALWATKRAAEAEIKGISKMEHLNH